MQPQRLTFSSVKAMVQRLVGEDANCAFASDLMLVTSNPHLLSSALIGSEPFMLQYTLFGLVRRGNATFTINLQPQQVTAGNLIVLHSDTIYELESCSDDFLFDICVISDLLTGKLFPEQRPDILDRLADSVVPFTPEQIEVASSLIHSLIAMINSHAASDLSVADVLRGTIRYCDSVHRQAQEASNEHLSREQQVFAQFLRLVNAHAVRERSIGFYAQQLCISRNYLSIIVSHASGIPAREWIERAVIMEAKALLRFSTMTIVEIADHLNFANDSFFNKYFKRATSTTPAQYRKRK